MTPAEIATFEALAATLAGSHGPWWVIGTGAAVLWGLEDRPIKRLEVAVTPGEIRRLVDAHGWRKQPAGTGPSPLYRARMRLAPDLGEIPVELLAGLDTRTGGSWTPVALHAQIAFTVGAATIFTPDRASLAALYDAIGRPRDRARAEALRAG